MQLGSPREGCLHAQNHTGLGARAHVLPANCSITPSGRRLMEKALRPAMLGSSQ